MNILATTVGSQSHDVIVGEIETTREIPDSPKTGVFGSELTPSALLATSLLALPVAIILIYLLKHPHYRK